jgi:hypothetical protein
MAAMSRHSFMDCKVIQYITCENCKKDWKFDREIIVNFPPFFFAMLEQVYIPFGMITEQTDRAAKRIFGLATKYYISYF